MATVMKVPTIFTAVDKFSDVVSTMTRNVNKFGDSASAASTRIANKMGMVGTKMMATSAIMLGALALPVNKAIEFEDQIASIGTLLPNLNADGLKKLGDDILNIARKTSTPIDQLTKSFYDLISAGETKESSLSMIKSIDKLSITGLGSLTEATDIQLAAMRNFKSSFNSSDEAANALFKTVKYGVTTVQKLSESFSANAGFAGDLGITGQEFLSSIAAITTSKMPTSQAEIGIGSMANAIAKTTEHRNKILFSVFKKIGVNSGQELIKKNGGLLPALMKIKEVAKKAGINMQSVFGEKRASNAFMKLTSNTAVIDKYNESLKSINDKKENALGVGFDLKKKTGRFNVGMLKNNLDAMAIDIGTILIPAIVELTKVLTPMLKDLSTWIKENPGAVKGFTYLALAIGSIGAALTFGGWMIKFSKFVWSLPSIAGICRVVFGTISLWAGYAEISVAALLWEITLVVAIIASLVWVVIDMVQHWDDWKEIILLMIGPLGYVIMFLRKIIEHSEKISNAFAFEGWYGGLKAIGNMLMDLILTPLEKILNVISRLPVIGSSFEGLSSSIADYRSGFTVNPTIGNATGSSQFSNFGGMNVKNNPFENLAGKNNSKDGLDSKGGTLTVVIDDKSSKVKDIDQTKLYGIPVVLSNNQGNWGK